MKISKLFHSLYASVMALPLLAIPIFAVYSNNQNASFDMSIAQEETKVVIFNQLIQYNDTNFRRYSSISNGFVEWENPILSTLIDITGLQTNHVYYAKNLFNQVVSSGTANPRLRYNGTYYYNHANNFIFTCNGDSHFYVGFSSSASGNFEATSSFRLHDLTLMFGAGNEPTMQQFDSWFTDAYYPYDIGSSYLIENYASTTYSDTDIASQYVYSLYNTIDKYFNFDNVFNFGDLYSWLQETFFSGTAPLGFFIFWHYLTYWLLISLIWLIFDVLMYVPNLVHSWLDKGGIE